MSLEIFLTEGPNVVGLSKDRVAFYVGYCDRKEDLAFFVIEGRKTGTPSSLTFILENLVNLLSKQKSLNLNILRKKQLSTLS